jgi:hypothetical protein
MTSKTLVAIGLLGAFAVAGARPAAAGTPPPAAGTPPGWVGLFRSELTDWLENVNRLDQLCGPPASDPSWQHCRARVGAPRTLSVPLFAAPDAQAAVAGSLEIVATPGEGLRVYFIRSKGATPVEFTPDLFDPDYGYGPYFHETFLEQRGTWFRLPGDPFAPGTWIDAADFGDDPHVRLLEAGDVVSSPRGDLSVVAMEGDQLRARPEDPSASPCNADRQPPTVHATGDLRIPIRELYDANGHLLVHLKYTRGC